MPRVCALYRYPVKGCTPEKHEALTVLPGGRIAGDRALGFRFAGSGLPDTAWSRKLGFVTLVNLPALAKLDLRFDAPARRLRIAAGGTLLADESIDGDGRARITAAVEQWVLAQPNNPLAGRPERLPLELIGDGITPRYHDAENGEITLHGRASLAAAAAALGVPDVDELRFRSNIAIDGVPAWEELGWVGRRLRIGAVEFAVERSKSRCLATDVHPTAGVADLKVMMTIKRSFNQPVSTFAVALNTTAGGEIRIGDAVELLPG